MKKPEPGGKNRSAKRSGSPVFAERQRPSAAIAAPVFKTRSSMRATRIIVMRGGVAVESGTHAELSANADSAYSRFMKHQLVAQPLLVVLDGLSSGRPHDRVDRVLRALMDGAADQHLRLACGGHQQARGRGSELSGGKLVGR